MPESYRVTPRLLAGKYPGAKLGGEARAKLAALLDAGVRTFVDLTEDWELLPYAHLLPREVAYRRIAVADVTCPSAEQVREALDTIAAGAADCAGYVHCRGLRGLDSKAVE